MGEEKKRKFDWSVEIINPDTLSKIKEELERSPRLSKEDLMAWAKENGYVVDKSSGAKVPNNKIRF